MKRIIHNPSAVRLMAASAFLALGAAEAAPLNGAFSWANMGSGNSDTLVGLNSNKTYLENIDIWASGASYAINGVNFTPDGTTWTGGAGAFGTTWSAAGASATFPGGGTNPGGSLGTLTNNFVYGGNPLTVSLGGLTVGQTYIMTFYGRSWEAAGGRQMYLSASNNGPSGVVYDEDYLATAQGELELLRYTFQAAAASQTVTITPVNSGTTFHFYGFGTEQTFNNSWASGGDWTTATWGAPGVPNAQGANANFTDQGSPAAIDLDAPVTVGHLQFDGANGWTVNSAGSNALTLQADAGGVSVLSTPSGTHTIATPMTWSNDVLKTGAGTLILSGPVTGNGKNLSVLGGTLDLAAAVSGTLTAPAGTVTTSAGSPGVTTADFSGGTSTVTANTPLAVTGTLKLPGFLTGTLTGGTSFSAQSIAGSNLADNTAARTLALSGGTLALAYVTPSANLVANGSFETGTLTGNPRYHYNTTAANPWTFNATSGTDANAPTFAALATTWGNHFAFLQGPTSQVNQTVIVTQAGSYQITFNSISRGGGAGPNPLKLYVDGTEVLSWTPNTTSWQAYTSNAVALTAGTHAVSFRGQGGVGDLSSCVDNVAMTAVAPSPLINLPNTGIAASANSTLDLGAAGQDHTLGGLGLTANGAGTTLSVANANNLTVNGITAAAGSGTAAAISGPTLKNIGDSVGVGSGATLTINPVLADGSGGGSRANALAKTGDGTLVLTNSNSYTGATSVTGGTLALGASASLNTASSVSIAAGATFDVSAIATYAWGAGSSLTANGSASAAATLKGGTTVSMGTRPTTLDLTPTSFTGDASHPALHVSAGSLDLGTSLVTVNNNGGTPLGAGDYTLISGGTVTGTPVLNLAGIGGSGIAPLTSASLQFVGGNLILHVAANVAPTTTTIALQAPWTTSSIYGDALVFDVTVTGSSPGGTVTVYDGGAGGTVLGSGVLSGGATAVTLNPLNALQVGTHANIVAVYGGDPNNLGSTSSPLYPQTVAPKTLTVTSPTAAPKYYDGTNAVTWGGTLAGGVVGGDSPTLGAVFASTGPGTAVPVTFGVTGSGATNYTVTQPGITADILAAAVWTGLANDTLWDTAGNWFDSVVPSAANLPATFGNIVADQLVNLNSPRVIGSLAFDVTDPVNSPAAWTLANNGNAANTLTLAGTTPTVTVGTLGTDKNATISAVVAGTDGLTKVGDGTLVLTGANLYSGGTNINAGTLQLGNGGTTGILGTGTVVNNANLALDYATGSPCDLTNTANGTGTVHVINGDLRIHAQGSTGTITVDSGGDVTVWAPGAVTLSNDFVLNSMGFGQSRGAINQDGGGGRVTLNGQITLAGDSRISCGGLSWNSLTANGKVTGIGKLYVFERYQSNPSTELRLTNAANDYAGGTVIEAGRLSITQAGALGAGTVTITSANSQLMIDELTATIPNNFTLGSGNPTSTNYAYGNGTLVFHNDGKTATLSGTVTLASSAKIRHYSAGGTTIFSNPIGGTGNLTFEAGGAVPTHNQTWLLEGGASTYVGNTTIRSDGTANAIVRLAGGALPSATVLTLEDRSVVGGNNAVFDLNGYDQMLAGLSRTAGGGGLGSFVTNGGAGLSTLTINDSGSNTFSGVIGVNTASATTGQAAGSNDIALVKSGAGTLTLSGANTYTGATSVNEGALLIGVSGTVGTVTIANAGFETPVSGSYTYNPGGAGWTFNSRSGVCQNTFNPTAPPQGSQCGFIQDNGAGETGVISQSISVGTTGLYQLTFQAEGRNGGFGPCGVIVEVDGNPVATWDASAVSVTQWQTYQASFALTAGSHILAFVANNTLGGDKSSAIDNVQMVEAGVLGSLGNTAVTVASGATFGGIGTSGGTVTWEPGAKASFTVTLVAGLGADNTTPLTVAGVMTCNATEVHLALPVGLPNGTYTLATSAATPLAIGAFPAPVLDSGSYAEGSSGSISLAGNNLVLTVASSATNPYQEWAGVGGPAFTDLNSEGVPYGMAWMLGTGQKTDASIGLMPAASPDTTGLKLTFKRVHDQGTAKLHVEYSTDLGTWNTPGVEIPANSYGTNLDLGDGITATITSGATDDITVTISNSHAHAGKLFGRLTATEN